MKKIKIFASTDKILLLSFLIMLLCGIGPCTLVPKVEIISPSHGDMFNEGETITFSGVATDYTGNDLTGSLLVWTSSIEGHIGTGPLFTKDDLSEGAHNITLSATDSFGNKGTDMVSITIRGDTTTTTTIDNGTTTSPEILQSSLPRDENPQLQEGEFEELVSGNTEFAFDFYHVVRSSDKNLFFSPHSISIALAMTYAGARNNTEKQMADALHFTLSQERLHPAFNALDLGLAEHGEAIEEDEFRLHICNATWGQKDYEFLQTYLDILAVNYGAGLQVLDFINFPEDSRITINNWVSDQTEERIKELLPKGSISPDTRLVLTNAIYFKAGWLFPFEEAYTQESPFFLKDGSQVTVSMMSQCETFGYAEVKGDYQAIELPYKGQKISMVILLPAKGTFDKFESSLNTPQLNTILTNLTQQNVQLSMPSFTFDWEDSLVRIFESLGMTDAFTFGVADFSGINGELNLAITEILHKAFVLVDEKGTEAAAATAVIIGETAIMEPEVEIILNHPFIFLIRDRDTGTILFLGRVLNPDQ